jgi:hypothetical protein
MLVLFLLGAAVCCCTVTGVDLPETAFNEADLPANLAVPAPPRIPDIPSVAIPAAARPMLPLCCADGLVRTLEHEPAVLLNERHLHSLQVLLCTFLI